MHRAISPILKYKKPRIIPIAARCISKETDSGLWQRENKSAGSIRINHQGKPLSFIRVIKNSLKSSSSQQDIQKNDQVQLISQGVRGILKKALPVRPAVSVATGIMMIPVIRNILFQGISGSSVIFFLFRRMCSRTIPTAPMELMVIISTP